MSLSLYLVSETIRGDRSWCPEIRQRIKTSCMSKSDSKRLAKFRNLKEGVIQLKCLDCFDKMVYCSVLFFQKRFLNLRKSNWNKHALIIVVNRLKLQDWFFFRLLWQFDIIVGLLKNLTKQNQIGECSYNVKINTQSASFHLKEHNQIWY